MKGKDEIAAVARSFNRAAERIERLVEGHRTLLANASHELRSPVARLRMAVDLGAEPGTTADTPARGEIVQSLGEIDALVEEILLASRSTTWRGSNGPSRSICWRWRPRKAPATAWR